MYTIITSIIITPLVILIMFCKLLWICVRIKMRLYVSTIVPEIHFKVNFWPGGRLLDNKTPALKIWKIKSIEISVSNFNWYINLPRVRNVFFVEKIHVLFTAVESWIRIYISSAQNQIFYLKNVVRFVRTWLTVKSVEKIGISAVILNKNSFCKKKKKKNWNPSGK